MKTNLLLTIPFCLLLTECVCQTMYDTLFIPEPSGISATVRRSQNDLEADNSGRIWIALNAQGGGAYSYDTISQSGILYNSANTPEFTSDSTRDIFADSAGNIIVSGSSGVLKFDGTSWINLLPVSSNQSGWSNNYLIVATNGNGVGIFDGAAWTYSNTSNSVLNSNTIQKVYCSPSGSIYASTSTGLFAAHSWVAGMPSFIQVIYPSSTAIMDIAEDAEGTLYVINTSREVYSGKNNILSSYRQEAINDISNGIDCPPGDQQYTLADALTNYNNNLLIAANPQTLGIGTSSSTSRTLFLNSSGYIDSAFTINLAASVTITKSLLSERNGTAFFKAGNLSVWQPVIRIYLSGNTPDNIYTHSNTGEFLFVNEVKTIINSSPGSLHWNPFSQIPYYEVPKCENKTALYASGIWIGGLDTSGILHLSASTYNLQGDYQFLPGPLDTITGLANPSWGITGGPYQGSFMVLRSDIDAFQIAYANGSVQNGTYIIPSSIINWPAHGGGNYTHDLAPFVDFNADGNYNPMDGDYPDIKGDQMVFAVFNDNNPGSTGVPLGIEVHLSAYAYYCENTDVPQDSIINYTTFYYYKIINRSDTSYSGLKLGFWSDGDLGNAADDYSGSDVMRNTGYFYNGDNDDDGSGGYGIDPPAIGITVLNGPEAPLADGIDNNNDGTIDEAGETIGMSNFMYYVNVNNVAMGNPATVEDHYQYLNSEWLDGQHLTFGGDGRNAGNPVTNYMFSDGTDPAFPSQQWNMSNSGLNPDDVRFLMAVGPATLNPDEILEYEFAIVYGRATGAGAAGSLNAMLQGVDVIKGMYDNGGFPVCSQVGINENTNDIRSLTVMPNPARNVAEIDFIPTGNDARILIHDMSGRLVFDKLFSRYIKLDDINPGIYLITVKDAGQKYVARLVKY